MNDSLRLFVQKITKLPTLPLVAHEILSIARDDLVSIKNLEAIVSRDPAISGKIVSVSNAAFFGYKTDRTTVANAIQKLGFTNVKNIALGISLMTIFDDKHDGYDYNYGRIYRHSIATGSVAAFMAENFKIKTEDDLFLCGMLHDFGLLLLTHFFPDLCSSVAEVARERKNLLEAETIVLGFTHADIGAWLADTWNLPDTLHEVILYHHSPSLAGKHKQQVAIIHLADYIACKRSFRTYEEVSCPSLDPLVLFLLNMPERNFDDIESVIPDAIFANGIFSS